MAERLTADCGWTCPPHSTCNAHILHPLPNPINTRKHDLYMTAP